MTIDSWLSWPLSSSHSRGGQRPNPAARPRKARLVLEPLEARALLASYTAASVSALVADINAANTAGGANTITLTAATTAPYVLTTVNNTTYGPAGLPVIAADDNLTIVGTGDTIERSTAPGTAAFRLFDLATGGSLTLQSLTLQGGSATSTMGAWFNDEGGAIYNQGALTLSGVTVQHNVCLVAGGGLFSYDGSVTLEGGSSVSSNQVGAFGLVGSGASGYGGGLYAEYSTVTVTNATLDNNSIPYGGSAFGGGICVTYSTVTVTNATLNNNSVKSDDGGFAHGGGLYAGDGPWAVVGPVDGTITSTVTVTNTTLDNNSATSNRGGGCGGGVYVFSVSATISNDTVESNHASDNGCGLYIGTGYGVTVSLVDDTIESNTTTGNVGPPGYGGGLYIVGTGTTTLDYFTVANTINNKDRSGLNGSTANIDGTYTLIP